jgi:hypothetical protein
MIIVSNACADVSFTTHRDEKSSLKPRKRLREANYANPAGICQRPEKCFQSGWVKKNGVQLMPWC